MNYVGVVKASNHMDYDIDLSYVGQKFISQALTLGGSLYKSRNIDKLQNSGSHLSGIIHLFQSGQPFVGNSHYAHIRLYRTKRIVLALSLEICKSVEQRTFSHIGQTYDTKFHI